MRARVVETVSVRGNGSRAPTAKVMARRVGVGCGGGGAAPPVGPRGVQVSGAINGGGERPRVLRKTFNAVTTLSVVSCSSDAIRAPERACEKNKKILFIHKKNRISICI